MILQIFARAFSSGKTSKATSAVATIESSVPTAGTPEKKRVFLNSAITDINEREVVVLGSSGVKREAAAMTQQLKNGNTMVTNSDGSYIVRNGDGQIIKTCDVVLTKREYGYDDETGALLVKRFGLWTAPDDASLDEQGTLFFRKGDLQIEERLSGLHIQKNTANGITIQTHHHNNFELIKLANGEIWKRETARDKETFVIWKHGKLSFKSETFFDVRRSTTTTPNGVEPLSNVSRIEQSWAGGALTREKFSFKNQITHERSISLSLQLATGKLALRNVVAIVSTFEDGLPKDTTYELKEPVSFKLDIPSMKGSLDNIVKVRNFTAGINLGLCFVTKDGDEYVVFVGVRGVENRARAAAANSEMDMALSESGMILADLVLR